MGWNEMRWNELYGTGTGLDSPLALDKRVAARIKEHFMMMMVCKRTCAKRETYLTPGKVIVFIAM